ncbi:hypothetical protein [Paraburkholderia sediminicola]|uniref:hypothetical protein n=1 Tax=Paraburkholderia sediminicola TaxID=458836 RepID=UPI0038BC83BE
MNYLLPVSVRHIEQSELSQNLGTFDFVLCAASAEARALKVPRLTKNAGGRKLAFQVGTDDGACDKLTSTLNSNGFECIRYSEEDFRLMLLSFGEERQASNENPTKIVIDVSCIPRRIIASVMAVLAESNSEGGIELWILYNPARYVPPTNGSLEPNRRVAPVHPIFAGWTAKPGLPVRTIVGLGYERGKAIGAVEYIQSSDYVLLIPDSPEKRYRTKVEQHNRKLIKAARDEHVFEYDVLRPVETFRVLGALVAGMKRDVKPVLLPFGPKILFAVGLLVALVHREVSVWHVSGEEMERPVDKQGSSRLATLKVKLERRDPGSSPVD